VKEIQKEAKIRISEPMKKIHIAIPESEIRIEAPVIDTEEEEIVIDTEEEPEIDEESKIDEDKKEPEVKISKTEPVMDKDSTEKKTNPSSIAKPESGSTTIVSAYFPFGKSKFSTEIYDTWSKNFIGVVRSNIILYTSPDMVDFFVKIRGDLPSLTIRTEFPTVWDIPFLDGMRDEYEGYQNSIDPENEYHTAELYAVWNVKAWLLNYTSHSMTEWGMPETQIYLWTDTGAFRSESLPVTHWPQPNIVAKIFKKYPDRVLFNQIEPYPERIRNWTRGVDSYPLSWTTPHIAGGFFGGSKAALARWLVLFTETHDYFLAEKKFIGKDQLVMDATAITHKDIAMMFPVHRKTEKSCGDVWFMFQPLLSDEGYFGDCFSPEVIPIEEAFSPDQWE
jgi:hypothetical protein